MISHPIQKTTGQAVAAARTERTDDRAATMRTRAHAFCQALADPAGAAPRELIAEYMVVAEQATIHEHGPTWATARLPFLGREFSGASGCAEYFAALGATLHMEARFPGPEAFAVDTTASGGGGSVAVTGRGTFASVATGRRWDERFAYVLGGWDEAGRRFARWDVWADPLSAWVAVGEEDVEGWKKGEHRS